MKQPWEETNKIILQRETESTNTEFFSEINDRSCNSSHRTDSAFHVERPSSPFYSLTSPSQRAEIMSWMNPSRHSFPLLDWESKFRKVLMRICPNLGCYGPMSMDRSPTGKELACFEAKRADEERSRAEEAERIVEQLQEELRLLRRQ